jgi:hypothetical protein
MTDHSCRGCLDIPRRSVFIHSVLHLDVAFFSQVFQQVAALKVLVGMDEGLELVCRHDALVLGFLDFGLVEVLKHT